MDHAAISLATSSTKDYRPKPQPSGTAGPTGSAESSSHRLLTPAPSALTHVNGTRRTQPRPGGPPRGKLSLPFHPTAHPKEKLPAGFLVPPLDKMFTGLLQAPRPVGDAPSVLDQLQNIATHSWLNLFLVFIPISWGAVSDFSLILRLRAGRQSHTASPTRRDLPPCAPCGISTFPRGRTSSFPPPTLPLCEPLLIDRKSVV